jgi:hypothetical protein
VLWLHSTGLLFGHFLCHTIHWVPGSPFAKFPASTVELSRVLADGSGLEDAGTNVLIALVLRVESDAGRAFPGVGDTSGFELGAAALLTSNFPGWSCIFWYIFMNNWFHGLALGSDIQIQIVCTLNNDNIIQI